MKLKTILPVVAVAGVLMCEPAVLLHAGTSDFASPEAMGWFRKKKKSETKDSVQSKSDYEKLTGSDAIARKGMFNVYQKKSDYYFEVPARLLGRDMLVVNKLQRVPSELNEAGVNRGTNYENQMVRFELDKAANKLLVRQSRPLPLAPDEDAIRQSVLDNYISPLIAGFKIEAFNNDSTMIVVKVNDIYDGTETSINNVFTNINLGTSVIKNLSRILSIKAFENNVVATSELTTKVTEGTTTVFVTVEVSSSLLLLPEKPMMGRLDSPRVGYFTNPLLNYSDGQQRVDKKPFITRWRLEPKPEDRERYLRGELVEPAKPIVFYIENSTPRRWRKYIKQGIEDWQAAFERAGFKNAIVARELTDSMNVDKDDVNYSVLTYAASTKANAMGPSILDPRSGEILEADIMWWHNVLGMLQEWITVQTGVVRPEARGVRLPDELMGDAMRFVACHEVGHSLGLRHNMIASWTFPTDSLRSKTFTDRMNTTSSSIMDYARFNYVAQPEDNVSRSGIFPRIGMYDKWAIEWGYRWMPEYETAEAEIPHLNKWIIEKLREDKRYTFGTELDRNDPRNQSEDLGDDAMLASSYGIKNLKRVMPEIMNWTYEPNEGYMKAVRLYQNVVGQFDLYMGHVATNVAGIYHNPISVEQTDMKAVEYVPKDIQKKAVDFLNKELFTTPTWLMDDKLSERTGINTFNSIYRVQSSTLKQLLSSRTLDKMTDNELVNGAKAYTANDLFRDLKKSIWSDMQGGKKPDASQRSLQKTYVNALIGMLDKPKNSSGSLGSLGGYSLVAFDFPSEAPTIARGQLTDLRRDLTNAANASSGIYRSHYLNLKALIDAAFDVK